MNSDERKDVYTKITDTIIAELEKGVRPWLPNWRSTGGQMLGRPLRSNDEPYRGINTILLWLSATKQRFQSPYWFTFRQVAKLGGFVRKGERSTAITYAGSTVKIERDENGERHETKVTFLRLYSVFNLQQTEGLPERFHWPSLVAGPNEEENVATTNQFFENTGIEIVHGADVPHYSIVYDRVGMPPIKAFQCSHDFFATLAHEAVHWTGHPTRTPRDFRAIIGSAENYAREELVAELGAAFLCADLELSLKPRADHAEYIAEWLKVLRNDKRAIFQAASMAQKAVDFLHELQRPHCSNNARRIAA